MNVEISDWSHDVPLCDEIKGLRNSSGLYLRLAVPDKQVSTKHVESLLMLCLDLGSTPSNSTEKLSGPGGFYFVLMGTRMERVERIGTDKIPCAYFVPLRLCGLDFSNKQ